MNASSKKNEFQILEANWSSQEPHVIDWFKILRNDKSSADVAIYVGNEIIRTHKIVLATGSDYFYNLFTETADSERVKSVTLHNFSPTIVHKLLDLMYLGRVNVTDKDAEMFTLAARQLKVNGFSRQEDLVTNTVTQPEDKPSSTDAEIDLPKTTTCISSLQVMFAQVIGLKPVVPHEIPNVPGFYPFDAPNEKRNGDKPERRLRASRIRKPTYKRLQSPVRSPKKPKTIIKASKQKEPQNVLKRKVVSRSTGRKDAPKCWTQNATSKRSKVKKYKNYSNENMQAALNTVLNGLMTAFQAADKFMVPSRTLYDRLKRERLLNLSQADDSYSSEKENEPICSA